MNLFFAEFHSDYALLSVQESQHCLKVLRHRLGDTIWVTEGKGKAVKSEIIQIEYQQVKVAFRDSLYYGPKPGPFSLFIAPTKHADRTEWLVEKATELGIHQLGFFISKYSERRHLNMKRIEAIVESALKQSQRTIKPVIFEIRPLEFFLNAHSGSVLGIAHCQAGIKCTLKEWASQNHNMYNVFIGPEGDFSASEILLAKTKGAIEISLGEARLRTETAAIYACSVLQALTIT
jgi:16S rRNA (uracil1498-N3)-methyltransferase